MKKSSKPQKRAILNSPALCMATVIVFGALAYTSYKPTRLNCEDLGKCNLKTGQVYFQEPDDFTPPSMKQEVAQLMIDLYGETK